MERKFIISKVHEVTEEIIKMANGTQHTDWTTTAVSNDSSHAPMPVCDHDDCGPTECRRKAQHTDPQPSTDLESVREELATVSGKYGEAVQEIVRLRLEIGELKAAITKAAEEGLSHD